MATVTVLAIAPNPAAIANGTTAIANSPTAIAHGRYGDRHLPSVPKGGGYVYRLAAPHTRRAA